MELCFHAFGFGEKLKKRVYRIASNMSERKKGEQRHQRGTEILITFEQFHRTGGETKKNLSDFIPTHIYSRQKINNKY